MNNFLKYAAFASAATVLFFASFLAFSAMSGTPPHELALVGQLFPAPTVPEELSEAAPSDLVEEIERDKRPVAEVIETAATPLRAFVLQSPFSTDELDGLQRALKSRLEAVEVRTNELDRRDRDIDLRERQLEERWEELVKIRTTLIEHDLELEQREDELLRDERAQTERERASWESMAKIFADGKAKELAQNLILFPPEHAARILRALPDDRASELINAIPRPNYLEYAEAYRKAGI